MRTKVFVSFKKEDEKYFRKVRKWAIRQDFGEFDIFMTSSIDKGMRTRTGKLIKGRLERKIHEAKFIIVIVGDGNDQHPWRKLDEIAVKKEKKRFYMRIPYTSDPLPEEFQDIQQMAYNPNAVEKLMRDWVTLYGEDEPITPYEPKYKPRYSRSSGGGGGGYRPRSGGSGGGYRPRFDRGGSSGGGGYRDRDRNRGDYGDNNRRYDKPRYDRSSGGGYDRPYDNNRRYDRRDSRSDDRPYERKRYYKSSDDRSRSHNNRYDRPYSKSYDKPYNKPYDKPYEDKYSKSYDDKPYEDKYKKPYDDKYDKPYEEKYDKPYEEKDDKPYEAKYNEDYDKSYEEKEDTPSYNKDEGNDEQQ